MKHWLICCLLLVWGTSRAQVSETFSDGDFSTNPAWSGDAAFWQVNAAQQLQSNGPTSGDNLYLSTPNSLALDTEWNFWVKFDFSGTAANQVRVYLTSDQADLEGSLNGYYIGLGENGSADAVNLYRQQGPITTAGIPVISGIDGRAAKAGNNHINVRVQRTAAGLWTLSSDTTGTGTSYIVEGSATDNTITTSTHFGIVARYTTSSSTNRTKFFFDDISIAPLPVSLNLLGASATSQTSVQVQFSSPLDQATANNAANYTISGGVNVSQALVNSTDPTKVDLTLSAPLTPGTYTLTVSGITSQSGATVAPGSTATFTYTSGPTPVAFRSVVINELYADQTPTIGLPAVDFVELRNTTSAPITLTGFGISDPVRTGVLPAVTIQADSFLILTTTAGAALFPANLPVIGVPSFPDLNSTGDSIQFRDAAGKLIDQVNYTTSWFNDPVKAQGGWTLEQINPYLSCSGSGNWTASQNATGGTPGNENSAFTNAPDVTAPTLLGVTVISPTQLELLFSESLDSLSATQAAYQLTNGATVQSAAIASVGSSVVTLTLSAPLNASIIYTLTVSGVTDCAGNALSPAATVTIGIGTEPQPGELIINEIMAAPTPIVQLPAVEWIELYNPTAKLLKLAGVEFTDGTSTAALPAVVLEPGGYLLVASTTGAASLTGFGQVLGVTGFPSLNNDGDSLVLQLSSGLVLDYVPYTDAWYQDTDKDAGGWSLERKNPNLPCSSADNWSASNDPRGGTPGTQNSLFSNAPDVSAPGLVSAEVIGQNQLKLTFTEGLSATQVIPANFSVAGNTVVSAQLSGPDKSIVLLTFNTPFTTGIVYSITVSGITDCSGNAIGTITAAFGIGVTPAYHELLITEIMADPTPSVGLPEIEYLEIYNPTTKLISLSGVRLSDPGTTATLPNTILQPDRYLTLCATSGVADLASMNIKVLGVPGFPDLNATGDLLTLRDPNGVLIHSVNYNDDWYKDDTKDGGGWSLEMVDVTNPCGGEANWAASEDQQGGTPSKVNSIQGTLNDQTPPELVRADALSSLQVLLRFNEPLDSTMAAQLNAYQFSNGITVSAVQVVGPPFEQVQLTLSAPLQVNQLYTLTIPAGALRDCAGNLTAVALTATVVLGVESDSIKPGQLIINEILFNPRTGGSDYVELYNNSTNYINLRDWQLANTDNGQVNDPTPISLQPFVLGPGQYIVLTTNAAAVNSQYPLQTSGCASRQFLEMASMPSYVTDTGTVILLSPADSLIDRFDYNEGMHFALLDDVKGVSLERIRFDGPNIASNWHSAATSAGYGTPGCPNSQQQVDSPGNGPFTVNPKVFTPDNNSQQDFTTINYRFADAGRVANITIFDSEGRQTKKLANSQLLGTTGFYTWDGTTDDNRKAPVGYYVIFIELFNLTGDSDIYKETVVVGAQF